MKKVLVIAGTHVRENEYSHAVADKLVEYFGKRLLDFHVKGIDGAREAEVWDYEKLAVAKILKVGETSEEYLRSLDSKDLKRLKDFERKNKDLEFPPGIDSVFGGKKSQWTSVNDEIVDRVKPYFFIDLHSAHDYTKDTNGTGLLILSHLPNLDNLMKKCLSQAKINEPLVYGRPENNTPPGLSDEEITKLKSGEITAPEDILVMRKYGNEWFFKESRIRNERGFSFEAVHWQEKQQAATVNFIVKYLLPNLE